MKIYHHALIDTPLGQMLAVADDNALCRLAFGEETTVISQSSSVIESMRRELTLYFAGKLKIFKTPLSPSGTPFQKSVWDALQKIPYGETCSYADIAKSIGRPTAYRAVAQANGANPIAIVIPCHRVINSDGKLGGYSAGLSHKIFLLEHEKLAGSI